MKSKLNQHCVIWAGDVQVNTLGVFFLKCKPIITVITSAGGDENKAHVATGRSGLKTRQSNIWQTQEQKRGSAEDPDVATFTKTEDSEDFSHSEPSTSQFREFTLNINSKDSLKTVKLLLFPVLTFHYEIIGQKVSVPTRNKKVLSQCFLKSIFLINYASHISVFPFSHTMLMMW